LHQLHIVTITSQSRDDPQVVSLTKNFQTSLRLALTGGGDHHSFGVPSNDISDDIDLAYLDRYARNQWEGILYYVVNSVGEARGFEGNAPTKFVKDLLEVGKLVTTGRHTGVGITKDGFSFLLQETNAQVWLLLVLWIRNAEQVSIFRTRLNRMLMKLDGNGLG
jgi:transcription initiation factor TFIIH subunit 4